VLSSYKQSIIYINALLLAFSNASRINVEYRNKSLIVLMGGWPVVIIGSALLEFEMVWLVAGLGISWMELPCVGSCEVEVS